MTNITPRPPSKSGGTLGLLSTVFAVSMIALTSFAQTPAPSPSPGVTSDRFTVRGSGEFGWRWEEVNGYENKYRSDLNYGDGFRVFDSSFVIEDNGGGTKAFDKALLMASGWGSDPGGFFRANVERNHWYRFDANVRKMDHFNNLNNHAIGATKINYHNYDTQRNFGDLDLTILPDNRKIRFRVGGGYSLRRGDFTYTSRQSDVFPILADSKSDAYDVRLGADGRLFGFNLSGTYGYRNFEDDTFYRLVAPDEGDQINSTDILRMERRNPIRGNTHFGQFSVQRTFAETFDFTARILHSVTSNEFTWQEFIIYTTPTLIRTDYNISGDSSRPQTRGDLGFTWRLTSKLRLSNTFTYDGFNTNGGNLYLQNPPRSGILEPTRNYTITRYRRYSNLVEGDYQVNNRFAFNIGYRFTHREFRLLWTSVNRAGVPVAETGEDEEGENTTNTIVAGTRIKPLKNWAIYADVEKGKADNVFTRAGNADFTNFRIKSQMRFNRVGFNLAYITRDNEIPVDTTRPVPRITDTKSRSFSTTVDWDPIDEVSLSGGYNYLHITSRATVNFLPTLVDALSEYFVRDNYFFIDATVRPHRRVSFFGSYRWNKDKGHDDRVIPALATPYILGSYPFDFKAPEVKLAIRLNKYVDWNLGYQYFDYKEEAVQNIQWVVPNQNYNAHLPYTSLRIFLGRGAGDR